MSTELAAPEKLRTLVIFFPFAHGAVRPRELRRMLGPQGWHMLKLTPEQKAQSNGMQWGLRVLLPPEADLQKAVESVTHSVARSLPHNYLKEPLKTFYKEEIITPNAPPKVVDAKP